MTVKLRSVRLAGIGVLSLLWASAGAANTPVPVKESLLLADVRMLASAEFAGRRTGTAGNRLAQAYISRRFEQIGLKPFGASYAMPFSFFDTRAKVKTVYPGAVNLVGYIRGSAHPERYIVVSAHYDHLGVHRGATHLGADDNASGVAAMLAVAAHFKQHPPKNTIVFAAFDGEELGLRGANAFVDAAPVPIRNVALNLNFDMVSRSVKNEIYAAGTRYRPALKALVEKAAIGSSVKVLTGHDSKVAGAPPDHDWTNSSDHAAFHKAGIAFVYFGVEDHPDYHQPGDTFEKIDPVFFAAVTRMLVTAADVFDEHLDAIKK